MHVLQDSYTALQSPSPDRIRFPLPRLPLSLPTSPLHSKYHSDISAKDDLFPGQRSVKFQRKEKLVSTGAHRRVKPVKQNGKRVQSYGVMPSERVQLFHGLPFQKYNSSLIQADDMQNLIITSETKVLLDKVRGLSAKLSEVRTSQAADTSLFDFIDDREQERFNALFEETIGLVHEVGNLLEKSKNQASDRLRALLGSYTRSKKRKNAEAKDMNLLLQFVARARFNVGEICEEYTFQESSSKQHAAWLSKMASMSALQNFVPGEVKRLLRSESIQMFRDTPTYPDRDMVRESVRTAYKHGSLERNIGLAVLHNMHSDEKSSPVPETNSRLKFITKQMAKFHKGHINVHKEEVPVQVKPVMGKITSGVNYLVIQQQQKEIEDANYFRNFSNLYTSSDLNTLDKLKVAKPAHRRMNKGDKEVLRALKIGLRVSSDEKRFSAIKSLMEEHDRVKKTLAGKSPNE